MTPLSIELAVLQRQAEALRDTESRPSIWEREPRPSLRLWVGARLIALGQRLQAGAQPYGLAAHSLAEK